MGNKLGGQCLLIMEFTRPTDRGELSLHETDALKTAWYTPLRDLLASLLPKWEVSILSRTYRTDGLCS